MRKLIVSMAFLAVVLAACEEGGAAPGEIVVQPVECPPLDDALSIDSSALEPIQGGLSAAGYSSYSFVGENGVHGFYWINTNAWKFVRTCENGLVDMATLNDKVPAKRLDLMEAHLAALEPVLGYEATGLLRERLTAYVARHPNRGVTGPSFWTKIYDDRWNTLAATYNREEEQVGDLPIAFYLEFHQYTCPNEGVPFCYYRGFPGLEFSRGESSSYTFLVLQLQLGRPTTEAPAITFVLPPWYWRFVEAQHRPKS
jgi:hypothetical protein